MESLNGGSGLGESLTIQGSNIESMLYLACREELELVFVVQSLHF